MILHNKHITKEFVTSKEGKTFILSLPQGAVLMSFLTEWFDETKKYIKLQTSGSTGKPKTIKAPKIHLIKSARRTNSFFNLSSTKHALLPLPLKYVGGKMMVIRALVGGFHLTITEPSSSPSLIPQNKVFDFAPFTPFQLTKMLLTQEGKEKLKNINQILIGGSKVNSSLIKKLQQHNLLAWESFGMTETYSHVAIKKISPTKLEYFETLNGISLDTNNDSCLIIKGEGFGEKEITTTDFVKLKSSTKFKWLGRKDLVINSGGIKIHPELIEEKLEYLIEGEFYISKLPHTELGEQVVLILSKELTNHKEVLSELNRFEKPKKWTVVSKFPKTPNGKIDRKKLETQIQELSFFDLV